MTTFSHCLVGVELTDDQLSRSKWEQSEHEEIVAAQKKLTWILLLSIAAMIVSIISIAL